MPKKSEHADKSLEELEAEHASLNEQLAAVKAEFRAVAAALDEKRVIADAEARVELLSDSERTALLQVLKAEGIKSTAAVGTPGGS